MDFFFVLLLSTKKKIKKIESIEGSRPTRPLLYNYFDIKSFVSFFMKSMRYIPLVFTDIHFLIWFFWKTLKYSVLLWPLGRCWCCHFNLLLLFKFHASHSPKTLRSCSCSNKERSTKSVQRSLPSEVTLQLESFGLSNCSNQQGLKKKKKKILGALSTLKWNICGCLFRATNLWAPCEHFNLSL